MIQSVGFAWILIFVIGLTSAAPAALPDIYQTQSPKLLLNHRGEIMRRLEPVLIHQAKYLAAQTKPWDQDPTALSLTDCKSIEAGIRPNAHTIAGLAEMVRSLPEWPADFSKDKAKSTAIAMLKFLVATHGPDGKKCSDGKYWADQWQSALWAGLAGRGAWLLWDDLDEETKLLSAEMICSEADRFVGLYPPTQVKEDTKAEENAWDAMVIALAYNMFPRHPRHAEWGQAALRWEISSYVTSNDVKSEKVVDGKPLNEWLTGANMYDDYTLENHHRVHPDYMSAITLNLYEKLLYEWAGNPVPQAVYFNAENVYATLKKMSFPDGGWIYANGQDWHLRRNADWIDLNAMMASHFNDAEASALLKLTVENAEKRAARNPAWGIYAPGETIFASSQALMLDWPASAYVQLACEGEGPAATPESQLWQNLAGVHVFEFGKFALARSSSSVATFSWGRQIMGMVLPIQKDLLLSPFYHSLIGVITMQDGRPDVPVLKEVHPISEGNTFHITGILERAHGAIRQHFGFAALEDGRAVYVDTFQAVGKPLPASMEMGTLAILNDVNWIYGKGNRLLTSEAGERSFLAKDALPAASPVTLHSKWYNIDGVLGVVCLGGGTQTYHVAPTNSPGRTEQLFHLNTLAPNGALAGTVLVFYPGLAAHQTSEAAGKCAVDHDGSAIRVHLEDGREVTFDFQP